MHFFDNLFDKIDQKIAVFLLNNQKSIKLIKKSIIKLKNEKLINFLAIFFKNSFKISYFKKKTSILSKTA